MATSFKDLEREFSNLLISDVNETGKELGRGSYGEVREAELLGAPCATKRVHPILLTQSGSIDTSKVAADFVRECRTWKNLRHPNIVQLFGVFFEQDSPLPVLVMERLSTSLRYYLKTHTKEVVPQERKATILRHVALGLAYLHKLKNVHRDLSPNNILLDTEGWRAKITDFGVSRAFVSEGGQMTGTSAPGTPAFMPPEVFGSPAQFSDKVDVFSLGCVIIFTLTHQWPEPDLAKRTVEGKIVGLSELERREKYLVLFSEQERDLYMPLTVSCLQEDPSNRPSSADLAERLLKIAEETRKSSAEEMAYKMTEEDTVQKQPAQASTPEVAQQQDTLVFPSDANAVHLDVSQAQQDPMHYDASPNTPNHEPSSLQEAHEADGGADVKTVHQNNGCSNSACLDSGNSEFGSKTQVSSTPTHGNTCSVCSYTEEVRIDTQNPLQKQLLRKIARAVDSRWTILARRLGVTEDIIEDIKSRSFTPPERCSALLKRLSFGECTWSNLQVALCQIGHCDLVTTIAEEISGSSQEACPQWQDSTEEPTIDLLDSKHLQLLAEMSQAMKSFWRPFCESQGLRHNDAETLSDTDKAFDLLIQWVKGQRRPTFQNLIEALREINLGYVSSPVVAILANSDDQ